MKKVLANGSDCLVALSTPVRHAADGGILPR